ncbi:MAG TPA: hypothetical protein DDX92_08075 [Flavobacteriales bacterium]|jgi:hypothetical protein|nr:hypothetical protein [Flavobacteriales bacterium]
MRKPFSRTELRPFFNISFIKGVIHPFFFSVLLISASACRKDDNLGRDVQPGDDDLFIHVTDTFNILAETIRSPLLRTDERADVFVGIYNDPVFGTTSSSFYTQVLHADEDPDLAPVEDRKFDSIILSMRFVSGNVYKDRNQSIFSGEPARFEIHEIIEPINLGSNYFSNSAVKTSPTMLGVFDGFVNLVDDVILTDGDTVPPQIRIRLSDEFGEKLLKAGNEVYATNEGLHDFFNGLYVKPVSVSSNKGAGALYEINGPNSRLELYFREPDSNAIDEAKTLFFPMRAAASTVAPDLAASFMRYEHDYENSEISDVLGNTEEGSRKLYMQGMAGTDVLIYFQDLNRLLDKGNIIINLAELYIPFDTAQEFIWPGRIAVARLLADSTTELLTDQLNTFGSRGVDGNASYSAGRYRFRITQYLEERLRAFSADNPVDEVLYLSAINNDRSPVRSVMFGTSHNIPETDSLKLVVTYTLTR